MTHEADAGIAACKRCGEVMTIECGYETPAHGFCWPCCAEIVEKLDALRTDEVVAQRIAYQALPYRARAAAGITLIIKLAYGHVIAR
jgi:hypothetical protein